MTIEFKKETDLNGVFYFTEVNGRRVVGSTKMNKDEAYNIFLRVVENEGEINKVETLETKQI